MTVFIDLVGFGIILPLSPYLARAFQATPAQIGLLMAVYSLCQFLFSPFWGSLSDRIGRRPVILISLVGGGLSYLLFAFADALWVLFVARGLAGIFGGNISTAHAYIADVTTAENRSKGMGLLGAAFGLGFIFGPLLGGLLAWVGAELGEAPPLGASFPALGAAMICLSNAFLAFFVLKESLPVEARGHHQSHLQSRRRRFVHIAEQMRRPLVGSLIWVFFLSGLAMAQMEAMLFTFMDDRFGWGMRQSSYGFAYVGVLMVITQGVLIRKWMPKFGEPKLLSIGLLLFALSLMGIAVSSSIVTMAIVMTILALGNGLMRPPNLGMISLLTPPSEQGLALGVTNSLASLGRIIGPMLGGWLYQTVGHGTPFWFAGGLALVAFGLVIACYGRLPASGQQRGQPRDPRVETT
ncbi:MAG: MFS transporter [Bdellovibrionaceae bacterium]|nr:MFS transporter [Pseudobdellovibrionaceae bacterium]